MGKEAGSWSVPDAEDLGIGNGARWGTMGHDGAPFLCFAAVVAFGLRLLMPARDCALGDWDDWSVCSQETGEGFAKRTRELTPATGDGKAGLKGETF